MAGARLFWVDAFAPAAFTGNPAAVCLTADDLQDGLKQDIARELNLSETVFIWPQGDAYGIRWYTPTREVPLVGHATLAAACVVLTYLEPARTSVVFSSPFSGELAAYRDAAGFAIELPADRMAACPAPADLVAGLGTNPAAVHVGRHYMALFDAAAAVAGLRPDFAALARLDRPTIIATAPGPPGDYVLRFFAPANGVPEDPVSGVAQCSLVPYWTQRLRKERLVCEQLSSRGGRMLGWMREDRVVVAGPCRSIFAGELTLAP